MRRQQPVMVSAAQSVPRNPRAATLDFEHPSGEETVGRYEDDDQHRECGGAGVSQLADKDRLTRGYAVATGDLPPATQRRVQ